MRTLLHALVGRRTVPAEVAAPAPQPAQLDGYAKRDLERELRAAGLTHSQSRFAVSVFTQWRNKT